MKKIVLAIIAIQLFTVASSQVKRMPSYPLVTHDPYFSVWSSTDTLNTSTTVHWTGKQHSMIGIISVDGKPYTFLGKLTGDSTHSILNATQLSVDVSATQYLESCKWIANYSSISRHGAWSLLHYQGKKKHTSKIS